MGAITESIMELFQAAFTYSNDKLSKESMEASVTSLVGPRRIFKIILRR